MAELRLENVVKKFGETEVLHGVDLSISDKEFTVFVGPSGCGKSTLLRLIAGLEDLTSGEIYIDDQDVGYLPPAKRGIAMVFQSYALYPHMTVYDNMAFSLRLAKTDKATMDAAVQRAARILQIEDLLERKPKALSGGQRQRVAIGRAIVRDPRVFLFDEPLSNLDAKLRVQMRMELTKLQRELEATIVYVTHDQVEAMTMADKIVVLRDGYVEQVGSPLDLYRRPANLFVAQFIGSPSMNVLEVTAKARTDKQVTLALPGETEISIPVGDHPVHAGDTVTVGVRPEHLKAGGGASCNLSGEVMVAERLGGFTYLHAKLPSQDIITLLDDGDSKAKIGDKIDIGIPNDASHLFDAKGVAITNGLASTPT